MSINYVQLSVSLKNAFIFRIVVLYNTWPIQRDEFMNANEYNQSPAN